MHKIARNTNSPGELEGLAPRVGLSATAGVPEGLEGMGLGSLEAMLKDIAGRGATGERCDMVGVKVLAEFRQQTSLLRGTFDATYLAYLLPGWSYTSNRTLSSALRARKTLQFGTGKALRRRIGLKRL